MSNAFDFETAHIGVLGLGLTGRSCLRFLNRKGVSCTAFDTRPHIENLPELQATYPNLPFYLGSLNTNLLENIDCLIVSPGVALTDPFIVAAHEKRLPVISDISLFQEVCDKPIIAVTGTNGKSTVVKMIHHIATSLGYTTAIGGNYGVPALDLLDDTVDYYVLELSSFQLDSTDNLKNHVACYLNTSADHLDRYATFEDYVSSKQKIYRRSQYQIYAADDITTHPTHPTKAIAFTSAPPAEKQFGLQQRDVSYDLCFGEKTLIASDRLPFFGKHNYTNALAALAVANALAFPLTQAAEALTHFTPLPHRCEIITTRPVTWINDSKSTNVAATLVAIDSLTCNQTLKPKIILLLGGIQKLGDNFSSLLPLLEKHAKAVVIFGQDQVAIADALSAFKPCYCEKTLAGLVERATALAEEGDTVLFSPACASFDAFKNYADRGLQFRQTLSHILDPH